MKKIVAMFLVVTLMCCTFSPVVMAEENIEATISPITIGSTEQKVYSNATIEDDFADNRVMVVLSNKKSLEFKNFETDDFPEIDCVAVRDLSQTAKSRIEDKVEKVKEAVTTRSATVDALDVSGIDIYNQVICLELKDGGKENVLAAVNELQMRDGVVYAGPDYTVSISSTTPNDTNYSAQWAPSKIQLPEAWDITTGSPYITVGVLDSGVDATHPDLINRVNVNASADFTNGSTVVGVANDQHGHGTHVAGIIAAEGNNNNGISGVCWNVKIVSLRVMGANGSGDSSHIAAAINYADSLNIPLLNMSIGYYDNGGTYDYAMEQAIENYSGLLVCSAGNNATNIDFYTHYPSAYEDGNVIVVGASTSNDQMWFYTQYEMSVSGQLVSVVKGSNYGQTSVDVFAPGVDIFSTLPNGNYDNASGTSMAAPIVTGVAALIMSKNPNLSPSEIKSIIMMSCDKVDAFSNLCVSGGRLNAYKAVSNANIYTTVTANNVIHADMSEDDCDWYKFTATTSGYQRFYTDSDLDLIGELFHELVSNESTAGRLVYEDDLYEPDDGNDPDRDFDIMYYLNAGETVYLRVSAHGSNCDGTYKLWTKKSA